MKKKVFSIGFIVLLTAITFYIVLSSSELVAFPKLICILNPVYLLLAIGCMLVYFLLTAAIFYAASKEIIDRVSFKRSLYLAVLGQYYGAITPFASGMQPAQIMVLKNKYDVSVAKGTTIIIKKSLIYHLVLSFVAGFLYLYRFQYIQKLYSPTTLALILIGLIANFIFSGSIIMLAYMDAWIKKLMASLLSIAHKIRLFKKLSIEEVNKHIDEYAKDIGDIRRNKKAMFGLIFLTLIQVVAYFSVTYFVYLAFGQRGAKYFDILAVQLLIYLVASFIPTPGNAGASEGGFYVILQPFFPSQILLYAMAIWRIITYYGIMLLSGLAIIVVKFFEAVRQKSRNVQNKE